MTKGDRFVHGAQCTNQEDQNCQNCPISQHPGQLLALYTCKQNQQRRRMNMRKKNLRICAMLMGVASVISLAGCMSKPSTSTAQGSAKVEAPEDI